MESYKKLCKIVGGKTTLITCTEMTRYIRLL